MRGIVAAVLVVIGACTASAQHRGGHPGIAGGHPGISVGINTGPVLHTGIPFRTYGSSTGFGNILFPGTGNMPPMGGFADRFGSTISGSPGYGGIPWNRRGRGSVGAVWPLAYPVVVGDAYGYEQAPPNVTIVMPPVQPQASAPPVTIQQYFGEGAKPVVREYGPNGEELTPDASDETGSVRTYRAPAKKTAAPSPDDDRVMFMVALKDSSVYTAVAYWVEGETLHYITTQGDHNQVSLDLVDRATSDKLNRGRKVPFRLPPPKG